MSEIAKVLDDFRGLALEDEDGEPLEVLLESPLAEEDLDRYEQSIGVELPHEFRDLLLITNGMCLFGLAIMPVDQQTYFRDQGIIAFHNWGNGDFDCVAALPSKYNDGTVVFMNHSPDVTARIAESLSEWLEKAVLEIQGKGALLHPSDYREGREQGVYQHVLESLSGIACELNR